MHCDCCDKLLTDYEASFKGKISGEYLNTCSKCLEGLGIAYTGNNIFTDKEVNELDEYEVDVEDLYIHPDKYAFVDLEDD
jgi:hypothetical protein